MYIKTFFSICLGFLFISASAQNDSRTRYIDKYKEIAILEMERTGIPASIKLAQGVLESNAGTSELAMRANNHFGMKCGSQWTGKTYYKKDDDYDDRGQLIESCFRKYRDQDDSYIAHSEFLRDPRKQYRYGFLFRLDPTDYKAWAKGLREAGYATSATYHRKLIDIIERYQLDRFDRMTSPEAIANEGGGIVVVDEGENIVVVPGSIFENNDVRYVLAAKNESLTDISVRTEVKLSDLLEYNEKGYGRSQTLPEGAVVYLQSKRKNFRGRRKWHYVKANETMFSISQTYGIRLDCLYDRNEMKVPQQPAVGERLKIRGGDIDKRPVLKSEVAPPPKEEDKDKPPVVEPEVDEDGNLILDEDEFEEETEEPKDKKPLIPIPDVDKPKDENTDKPPIPKPEPPITKPDTGFDEDELGGNDDEEEEDTVTPPPASTEIFYTVVSGDTLYSISRRYNTSVDAIKLLNRLNSNTISIGQRLRVK